MADASPDELRRIYGNRFDAAQDYRRRVWQVLIANFFQDLVPPASAILDLGCGYGEFINQISAQTKYGMDLNPRSREHLAAGVQFFEQDCSARWPLEDNRLDVVFTSNFFEHLPDKATLGRTLEQIFRCLKPGGRLIALGPNIKFTKGKYWDFWDHYLELTELSLSEGLRTRNFVVERAWPQFLPYTMAGGREYPLWMVALYLKIPLAWRFAGAQFLVIARKP